MRLPDSEAYDVHTQGKYGFEAHPVNTRILCSITDYTANIKF